jgi:hypothetical protein
MRTVIEICEENRAAGNKFMDMFELKSDTVGFIGPLVHKETGESYQAMMARSEQEWKDKHKNENNRIQQAQLSRM